MCMYMIQSDRSDTTREHESTRRACTTCRAHGPHGRAMRACTRTAAARSAATTARARASRRRRPASAGCGSGDTTAAADSGDDVQRRSNGDEGGNRRHRCHGRRRSGQRLQRHQLAHLHRRAARSS